MKQDNIYSSNNRVDRGWDKMHATLDVKMPQKKGRKLIFWWFFGIGFLVAVATFFVLNSYLNKETSSLNTEISEANSNSTKTAKPTISTENNDVDNNITKATSTTNTNEINNNKATAINRLKTSDIKKESSSLNSKVIATTPNPNIKSTEYSFNRNSSIQSYLNKGLNENVKRITKTKDVIKNNTGIKAKETVTNPNTSTDKLLQNSIKTNKKLVAIKPLPIGSLLIQHTTDYDINPSLMSQVSPIIKPNKTTVWSLAHYAAVGADYLYNASSIGSTLSLGAMFNNKKFSIGPQISYTIAKQLSTKESAFAQSNDSNEIRLEDNNPMGVNTSAGAFQELTYAIDTKTNSNIRYLSIGIASQYEVNKHFSFLLGLGKEFHFGSQLLIPTGFENSTLDMDPPEAILLGHNDTYYVEAGIALRLTSNLSAHTSYRYANKKLINIIDDNRKSDKVSLSLRYNF